MAKMRGATPCLFRHPNLICPKNSNIFVQDRVSELAGKKRGKATYLFTPTYLFPLAAASAVLSFLPLFTKISIVA